MSTTVRPLEVRITTPRTPLVAGHRVEFRCQTTGSRPAPRISWLKSTLKLLDVQDTYSTDGNLTLSTLSLVPDVVDSGKHITCRADNPALEGSALEDSTKLVVHCEFLNVFQLTVCPPLSSSCIIICKQK